MRIHLLCRPESPRHHIWPLNLWRMERDGRFPKRVPIGQSRVGWVEDEVKAWMQGAD